MMNIDQLSNQNLYQSKISRAKRTFDFVSSLLALIILSPVFPFSTGHCTDFSRSYLLSPTARRKIDTRKDGDFEIMKFRSMYQDAETRSGAVWATANDPNYTGWSLLRKTRLDELPQLFNVLKGEMSLIGPHPERPTFYNKLENGNPYFADRTYGVMPGITGLAS